MFDTLSSILLFNTFQRVDIKGKISRCLRRLPRARSNVCAPAYPRMGSATEPPGKKGKCRCAGVRYWLEFQGKDEG